MFAGLEYLMASLPYLSFRNSEEERVRVQSLLRHYGGAEYEEAGFIDILNAEAAKFLDSRAYELFEALDLDIMHREKFRNTWSPIVSEFATWLYDLKLQVVLLRNDRKDSHEHISPAKYGLPFQAGTPLEEEMELLKMQWDMIANLAAKYFNDQAGLMAYKIQFMILLRWWSFDGETGIRVFNELTTAV